MTEQRTESRTAADAAAVDDHGAGEPTGTRRSSGAPADAAPELYD